MASHETSIIVRTFNEEKHLPALLSAIERQAYRDYEVVVVDSGALDRTREIAEDRGAKVVRLESRDFTFGYSLNTGIRHATGKLLAIVSAHTVPLDEHWLSALVEPLREDKTAMVFGRQLGADVSKFSETQDFRRTFGSERRVLRPPRFFANNANSAVRKDLWERQPFDEALPGLEDIAWAKYWMERGHEVIYEPKAALYHIHEETWRQVRRRYHREAVAAHWIGIKGRRHAPIEVLRELGYTIMDAGIARGASGQNKSMTRRYMEILAFRANKLVGTVGGLMDGASMENSALRDKMFFDRSCKAAVIHGPDKASLDEIPIPEVKPADVLVRVEYEGVCATDLEVFNGTLSYYKDGVAHYPIVPGHEFSGRVVAAGPNVKRFREGDPVVVECIQSCGECEACKRESFIGCKERTEIGVIGRNGAYAEYVVVPARFAHRVPADLDMKKAALCEPLAVAVKGLKRLERAWAPQPKVKTCAVVGAGPLGHLCAKVLARRGHDVIAFDRDERRRNAFAGSDISVSDDVGTLGEFEVLVETSGDQGALETMLNESRAGATILLLGLPYAHRKFTFESVVSYDKTIVGSVGSGAAEFEEAIALLPEIDTHAFTEKVLPLEAFEEAWELARQRAHLKVLLAAHSV
jgi:2-desacetyl-2-hydroxyethyl bacteriochlorophyllide A dehydrogenase